MQGKKEQLLLFRIRQQGDAAAFAEVYGIYQAPIRRLLSHKLPSAEVDDVHAIVFQRLWNYLCAAPVEHLSGLVFTIARGAIAGYYRDRGISDEPLPDAEADTGGDEGTGSRRIEASAEVELVRKALTALDPEDRLLVEMRHFEGMTTKEVAQRTGKSEGAVRTALHRALERLREEIAD